MEEGRGSFGIILWSVGVMLVSEGIESLRVEMERMRAMASSGRTTASLGLSVEFGGHGMPRKSPPVQLNLLPMRSPHSDTSTDPARSSVSNPLSWQRLASRINTGGRGHDDGEILETYSSHHHVDVVGVSPRADIDMNQIPSETTDCDEAVVSSHTVSTICMKREREKLHVFDHLEQVDKGFDLSTRGGGSDDEDGTTRKKLRLSKEQSALLEESFKDHSTLNPKQKTALAKQLNLRPRQVEVWFQNRRARTKLKQMEVDCELLKTCCDNLTEENRRLQKELQELRALKVAPAPCVIAHDFYMPLPATTLTMCPSCERVATVHNPAHVFPKPAFSHFLQPSAAC